MSIANPIRGADSSDNNELDVKRLEREGYRVLIQRRTGGIDIANGKRVPYLDKCFKKTNAQIKGTSIIPGDYCFPIDPGYLDLDVQIDRFLHHGPTDFDGRIIAIDYEKYGPQVDATIKPEALKEFCRRLLKLTGPRWLLMYAGKSFWEEPPNSGALSAYAPRIELWAPKYPSISVYGEPWATYKRLLPEMGWWQSFAGGVQPVSAQFCIGRAAGIPLDINAWRIDVDAIEKLTRRPNG